MGVFFAKNLFTNRKHSNEVSETIDSDAFVCVPRVSGDSESLELSELSQEETRPLITPRSRGDDEKIPEADGFMHSQEEDFGNVYDSSQIGNPQISQSIQCHDQLQTTTSYITAQSHDHHDNNVDIPVDHPPMHNSPRPLVDAADVGVTSFSYNDPIQNLTANNAVILLEDCNFQFSINWEKLTTRLQVPKEERAKQKQQIKIDGNYTNALEELLEFWIRNSSHPTWWRLISAVEFYEQTTAENMRKKLGIISEECQVRLQRKCEDNMLRELSFIIPDFTAVAQFFLTSKEIEDIEQKFLCSSEKIHEMLWKWRERKGRYGTYLSLVEIFHEMKMDKVAEFVQENVEEPTNILFEEVHFPFKMDETKLYQLEDYNMTIRKKFASIVIKLRKSLFLRNIDPTDLKLYLLGIIGRCEKIDRAKNLSDIFLALYNHQSWFNFGLYEAMIEEFGGEEEKQELESYKTELSTYLKQSLIEIPNPVQQPDSRNHTKFFLKVPDYKEGLPNLSGCDVEEIKRNLARRLRIHSQSLSFCEYRLGCIELVFSMQTPLFECYKSDTLLKNITWDESKCEYRITIDLHSILPSSLCDRNEKLLQQISDRGHSLTASTASKTDSKDIDASLSYSLSVAEQ